MATKYSSYPLCFDYLEAYEQISVEWLPLIEKARNENI